MHAMLSVTKRELGGYFVTPVAYVFIIIFLVLAGATTFAVNLGAFWERGQADLDSFFSFHPWLYLFLIPALSMRLWAEERKGGTLELLMTLPVPTWAAVVGKYLAAWVFTGLALALTFPLWITVNQLGTPDNGAIAAAYLGSLLMAGGFLAIGSMLSATTRSQVIALVLTVVVCAALLFAGISDVAEFLDGRVPAPVVETVTRFSFLTRFTEIRRGVIDLRDVVFFFSLISLSLIANAVIVEAKKAD
ncbi:MAG: ABC transporter permease subunit [Planctomycetota bacterium]